MKIYNLLKPSDNEWKNFNILPYISFYWDDYKCYLNIGIWAICIQFIIKKKG